MKGRHASWRPAVVVVLAVILLIGLVAGLASALAASGSPSPTGGKVVLRVGWLGDPDNLNPFLGYNSEAYDVWYLNYEPLVGVNPSDLTPSKDIGLASDWSSTPDGKTWTFTLHPNVKWQDGQPLTANDVAFTYNWIVDNQNAQWISYLQTVTKATAIDATHVRIQCSKPAPATLANLVAVPILPEHIWAKLGYKEATKTYQNTPPIIGSGPFECMQWKKSDYIVMQANKNYWRGAPHIDQVVFQDYTNADTMAQDMKQGAIDACSGILQAQMTQLAGVPGITTKAPVANGYDELGFNCYAGPSLGNPVLKDWKFRQALQWAVDKNKLCQIGYGGLAKPADTVITADYYHNPDWHWSPAADQAYSFNLQKASDLLTAAGYPLKNGERLNKQGKPISLRLEARTSYPQSISCGKLLTTWFRSLGLKIVFSTVDDGALEDQMYNTVNGVFTPNYDMFEWGWYNDLDPGIELDYFTTSQIDNWSDCNWSYPAYDKLYKQQAVEMDQAKRLQMIYGLQQMIYEQSPYVLIAYSNDTEAYNTGRWTGWVTMPANIGNVVFAPYFSNENYFQVRPKTGATATTSAGRTGVMVLIGVVVVIVVAALLYMTIRRRTRKSEVPAEERPLEE